MIRNLLLTLATFTTILACATAQQPKFEFPTGTRIGIVNHLERQATHRNFSSLRVGNFSKQIDVDWDIPDYIEKKLSATLKADPRYTVILIRPAEPLGGINQEPDLSDRTLTSGRLKPATADYLSFLSDKYEVDVLISVRSYTGPSVFKIDQHPIELQGYGLFTKQLLMSKHAYAYAHIAVEVFKTEPLTYIGSGKPRNRKSPLTNINLESSLKNLPRSEIDKIEPIVKEYAEHAIENAMVNANLLPPE